MDNLKRKRKEAKVFLNVESQQIYCHINGRMNNFCSVLYLSFRKSAISLNLPRNFVKDLSLNFSSINFGDIKNDRLICQEYKADYVGSISSQQKTNPTLHWKLALPPCLVIKAQDCCRIRQTQQYNECPLILQRFVELTTKKLNLLLTAPGLGAKSF